MNEFKKNLVYVDYTGCEKRKLDAQHILDYFLANNFEGTDDITKSDILVYVTCAFIKDFENLSIKNIEKIYQNRKKDSKFIVSGCLPLINLSRLKKFENIEIIPVREMNQFDKLTKFSIKFDKVPDPNITIFENRKYEGKDINVHYSNTRDEYEKAKRGYKIRLGYGCLGHCSYCVTRFATKSLQSKPLKTIINEFENAIYNKQKTIFFTGGDSGAYGQDIGLSIVKLLSKLFSIDGNYKIYFHDFGIHWLIKYFNELIQIFKENHEKLGVFNFPIQSGSNKILKLMRRPYKIEEVIKSLNKLKREIPNLSFGTHILIGFPEETNEDFQKSIDLIKKIPFDFIMVFKYSDNPLVDSFKLSNKIKENIIKIRYERIMDIYLQIISKKRDKNSL